MSRKGITTEAELHQLARESWPLATGPRPRKNDPSPRRQPSAATRGSLVIPPPEDGCTYSASEAAAICHVTLPTIRKWIATGRRARGEVVYLAALAAPRGRIAPEALCRFLSRINGISITVREAPGGESPVDGDGGSENALGG